jgi:glycosyltransferase involved in cell wall biosynthesis
MNRRLLCLSHVPSHPANAGNHVRILEMCKALREAGWLVDFVYQDLFSGSLAQMQAFWGKSFYYLPYRSASLTHKVLRMFRAARQIAPWCVRPVLKALSRGRNRSRTAPMGLDDWHDPGLDHWLADRFKAVQYDAFLVEYFFASRALLQAPPGVRRVIDTHDVFALGASDNLRLVRDSWLWVEPQTELEGLRRADTVIAIQSAEAAVMRDAGLPDVRVVGHFVQPQPCTRQGALQSKTLLFAASGHRFNVEGLRWFHKEVFPLLTDILAPGQVVVAGNINETLEKELPFAFRGMLPDLRPAYEAARVVISPVLGGTGLKIKNVEAMAAGRALVSTPQGAVGLEPGAGRAFSVGATPAEFARELRVLLSDDALCETRMREGLQFVAQSNAAHLRALEGALLGSPARIQP